jgi:hypothetical protein
LQTRDCKAVQKAFIEREREGARERKRERQREGGREGERERERERGNDAGGGGRRPSGEVVLIERVDGRSAEEEQLQHLAMPL